MKSINTVQRKLQRDDKAKREYAVSMVSADDGVYYHIIQRHGGTLESTYRLYPHLGGVYQVRDAYNERTFSNFNEAIEYIVTHTAPHPDTIFDSIIESEVFLENYEADSRNGMPWNAAHMIMLIKTSGLTYGNNNVLFRLVAWANEGI